MKFAKILKVSEYDALRKSHLKHLRISGLLDENIAVSSSNESLYESEGFPNATQIEPSIIVLPECNVSIEALNRTVTQFINGQKIKENVGFSVGNYFSGDYTNHQQKCHWSEKCLCVALSGAISNREGAIAVAVQIMAQHKLPIILVINSTSILEITKDGNSQVKPHPQHTIKRINE